jgi:hypothetical protein
MRAVPSTSKQNNSHGPATGKMPNPAKMGKCINTVTSFAPPFPLVLANVITAVKMTRSTAKRKSDSRMRPICRATNDGFVFVVADLCKND